MFLASFDLRRQLSQIRPGERVVAQLERRLAGARERVWFLRSQTERSLKLLQGVTMVASAWQRAAPPPGEAPSRPGGR